LIIDFSRTIAPVEYAEAILVCDNIACDGSLISDLEMILRAITFRLSLERFLQGMTIVNMLVNIEILNPF
jgi:hypothetical protein